jgi:hypothetical protein
MLSGWRPTIAMYALFEAAFGAIFVRGKIRAVAADNEAAAFSECRRLTC